MQNLLSSHTSPWCDDIVLSPLWSSPEDYKGVNLLRPYARLLRPLSLFLLTVGIVGNPKAGDPGATPVSVIKLAFETWLCSYLTPVFCFPYFIERENESRRRERHLNTLSAAPYTPGYDAPINIPARIFLPFLKMTLTSPEFLSLYRETVTSLSTSQAGMSTLHPNFVAHRENPSMWNASTRLLINSFMPKFASLGTHRIPTILNLTIPRVATCATYPTTVSLRVDEAIHNFFPKGFRTALGDFTSIHTTPFKFEDAVSQLIPKPFIQEALFDREHSLNSAQIKMSRERAEFAIAEAELRAKGVLLADDPYYIDTTKHAGKFEAPDAPAPSPTLAPPTPLVT